MIILWTDALVFILIAVLTWLIIANIQKPYLREKWRKAYAKPQRMIALVVLVFFALIGFLDCLHYKPENSNQVVSVLDLLLLPNSEQQETTYSVPFATELFTPQMVKTADGEVNWVKPKLLYAPGGHILRTVLTCIFIFSAIAVLMRPRNAGWWTVWAICLIIAIAKLLMIKYHIFGTDKIGTDVFYASLKSIRTGLVIGILTTGITLPFAILFGAMAGYFRGWVDDCIQYVYTTLSSIPSVLLIAAAGLSLDAVIQRYEGLFDLMAQRTDLRLLMLCCILGLTSWTSLCRLIRGETLKLRGQDFILAARAMGLKKLPIIFKHIVPNLMHIILIALVLDFSGLVLAEAVLSYVGVGVDPSTYSWGNMINGARMEMGRDPIIWWSLAGAFILMFTLVLAANIFADGVRDAFDPRAT